MLTYSFGLQGGRLYEVGPYLRLGAYLLSWPLGWALIRGGPPYLRLGAYLLFWPSGWALIRGGPP